MSASTTAMTPPASVNSPVFWERLWRTSGIQFVVFFIIAYVIYGYQPQVGASPDALVAFYTGNRARILIAYGAFWFPWFMRRLAERPANVWFAVRNLF